MDKTHQEVPFGISFICFLHIYLKTSNQYRYPVGLGDKLYLFSSPTAALQAPLIDGGPDVDDEDEEDDEDLLEGDEEHGKGDDEATGCVADRSREPGAGGIFW